MSNNNNGGNGNAKATKGIVAGYADNIGIQLDAANSKILASEKLYLGKKLAHNYAVCCVVKAEKAGSFYSNMNNCAVTTAEKDTVLIQGKVGGYIKKSEDLSKQLKETTKATKELKNLLAEIQKKGGDLKEMIKEEKRCNLQIFQAIEDGLGEGEITKSCGALEGKLKETLEVGNKSLDAMIDIAGFFMFSNVYSLGEFGPPLEKLMAELKKNVAENIKSAGKNREEAQGKLTNMLKELSMAKFDDAAAESESKGLKCIHDEVCNYVEQFAELDNFNSAKNPCPKTPAEAGERLMELCKKVIKDNFAKGGNGN